MEALLGKRVECIKEDINRKSIKLGSRYWLKEVAIYKRNVGDLYNINGKFFLGRGYNLYSYFVKDDIFEGNEMSNYFKIIN